MKFIGHLDIMRYFQKAIRRANIPIAFSGGFSPHMIMSFAAPLGVGVTSAGEYFDMELTDDSLSSKEMENRLNATMAEGMKVISVRQIPDGKASACMSLVAAADYTVAFREGKEPSVEWKKGQLEAFFAQDSIEILRKTKRSEKITDIKPWIYKLELRGDKVWMQLSQGSVHNLKPELVMEAFAKFLGIELEPFALKKASELRAGDELLVQVTREAIKTKAPCVSSNLNFIGKYLVLTTGNRTLGISAKIPSGKREKLKEFLEELMPEDCSYGIILRTNGALASAEELKEELRSLETQFTQLYQKALHTPCYTKLSKGESITASILKDVHWK